MTASWVEVSFVGGPADGQLRHVLRTQASGLRPVHVAERVLPSVVERGDLSVVFVQHRYEVVGDLALYMGETR